jgi:hypothetical protein
MSVIINKPGYSVIIAADDNVFLRSKRRHIHFSCIRDCYDFCTRVCSTKEWRSKHMRKMYEEQLEDGILDAMADYTIWYETRVSRAKVHLRMVAKLLTWHKHSVEKLWDPSRPENRDRIMKMLLEE